MTRVLALALAVWAGAAQAQVQTDAAGLREIAGRLLMQGEAERAGELAQALLARDADDLEALFLLARASLATGDYAEALPPARRAHGLGEGPARYLAARILARAHAELGHYTRAQVWLRRAWGDAPDERAVAELGRDIQAVRAMNPLTVSLSFGAAPSSNINGGSSAETIVIEGLPPGIPNEFPLSGDARALSGFRISAGARLSYRLRGDRTSATSVEFDGQGRTYVLSAEARDQSPDSRGSDFSDASLSASLVHRWQGEGASGPSSVRVMRGQTWYDGERYTEIGQLAWDRSFVLSQADRLDLTTFADWTRRRNERSVPVRDGVTGQLIEDPETGEDMVVSVITHDEWWNLGLRGRWTHRLDSGDRTSAALTLRNSLDEVPDATFTGATVSLGYDWGEPVLGVRLGVSADLDWRQFDDTRYLRADDREDLRATLRASIGIRQVEFWGFEPTLGIEASRTDSNVSRMDKDSFTLDLGFRSSF